MKKFKSQILMEKYGLGIEIKYLIKDKLYEASLISYADNNNEYFQNCLKLISNMNGYSKFHYDSALFSLNEKIEEQFNMEEFEKNMKEYIKSLSKEASTE